MSRRHDTICSMERLSSFNATVLAALAQAQCPVHAAAILPEVAGRLGGSVNRGALARSLSELARAGCASSAAGSASAHGGPSRILYEITDDGHEALELYVRHIVRASRVRELSPLARAYLLQPPSGSKVAEAKEYGVDLALLSRALLQSPSERYREAVAAIGAVRRYAR